MLGNFFNAISSVFRAKPKEISEVNISVAPTAAPEVTAEPVPEPIASTTAPAKKKRTYTKKTVKTVK